MLWTVFRHREGDDAFLSNPTHCLRNLASDVSWGLTGLDMMGEVPTKAPLIAHLFLLTLPESDMKSQNLKEYSVPF